MKLPRMLALDMKRQPFVLQQKEGYEQRHRVKVPATELLPLLTNGSVNQINYWRALLQPRHKLP